MAFYTRAQIGLVPPKSTTFLGMVDNLYIHHSGSGGPGAYSVEEAMSYLRGVQQYHMSGEYVDIAYNYGFDQLGNVYELRGFGVMGGATYGQNDSSYAFLWIGDSNVDTPADASLRAMAAHARTGVTGAYFSPHPNFRGHRDAGGTSCPGDTLYNLIPTIKNYFNGGGSVDEATARQWVKEDYNTILGREPDQEGWDFWTQKLMDGAQRNDIRWIFLTGPEGLPALRNRIAVLESKPAADPNRPDSGAPQYTFQQFANDLARRLLND